MSNPRLSGAQLEVLRAIDAGEPRPKAPLRTLVALWRHGLILDKIEVVTGGFQNQQPAGGFVLSPHGRHALRSGRMMLSRRT